MYDDDDYRPENVIVWIAAAFVGWFGVGALGMWLWLG